MRKRSAKKGGNMKIGDATQLYRAQLSELRQRQQELLKLQKEQGKNGGANFTEEEKKGVILELSNLQKEYDAAQEGMNKLSEYSAAMWNAEVTRQQSDAMEDAANEMAKCMEVARRISKGDKVPTRDERKLMEYDFKLYMAAKNAGAIAQNEKRKKHKSLWEDEEEKPQETQDIEEMVNEAEAPMDLVPETSEIS